MATKILGPPAEGASSFWGLNGAERPRRRLNRCAVAAEARSMVPPFCAPQLLGALLAVSPSAGEHRPSKPIQSDRHEVEPESAPLEALSEASPSLEVPEPARLEYAGQGPSVRASWALQPPVLVRSIPPQNRELQVPEPAQEDTTPASQPERSWKEDVSIGAFVDTYAGVNVLQPDPGTPNALRAFDTANGFALHWAGVDAEYGGEVVGGTVGLRFGPSAAVYNGSDSEYGLQYVKQAYVTFAPRRTKGRLSIDLGKFDTLYGAEVADSQANFNYTRGALNWLGQPLFHTGLKMGVQLSETVDFTGMLVNGWNNSLDNNRGKSAGLQLAWSPSDRFGVYLGYLVGAEGDRKMTLACEPGTALDRSSGECIATPGADAEEVSVLARRVELRLRHFADVVVSASATDRLDLSLNADLGYDETVSNPVTGAFTPSLWYGAALGARVAITERIATAARGEYYRDLQGFTTPVPVSLGTGTLSLEFRPADMLLFRLDSRYEQATDDVFVARDATGSDRQLTFTLGTVIHTP